MHKSSKKSVSLVAIEERYGTRMAIFSVPLADKKPVFMCNYTTPYENENRAVVIVDAKKFLALWRAGPEGLQRDIAHGNPESWRHDRKFIDATDGFSYGFKNPRTTGAG